MTDNAPNQAPGAQAQELLENAPEALHPVLQSVVDNIRIILACLVALILAVAGTAIYNYTQASKLDAAKTELGAILAKAPAERVTALTDFVADAPEAMQTGARLELASALAESGQHEKAAEVFARIAADGNGVAPIAILAQATQLSEAGKDAEALKALKDAKATAPEAFGPVFLKQIALLSETTGDLKGALAAYEELLPSIGNANKSYLENKIAELEAKIAKNS